MRPSLRQKSGRRVKNAAKTIACHCKRKPMIAATAYRCHGHVQYIKNTRQLPEENTVSCQMRKRNPDHGIDIGRCNDKRGVCYVLVNDVEDLNYHFVSYLRFLAYIWFIKTITFSLWCSFGYNEETWTNNNDRMQVEPLYLIVINAMVIVLWDFWTACTTCGHLGTFLADGGWHGHWKPGRILPAILAQPVRSMLQLTLPVSFTTPRPSPPCGWSACTGWCTVRLYTDVCVPHPDRYNSYTVNRITVSHRNAKCLCANDILLLWRLGSCKIGDL